MSSDSTWELAPIRPKVLSRIYSRDPSLSTKIMALVAKLEKRTENRDIRPLKGEKNDLYRARKGDLRAFLKRDGKLFHLLDIRVRGNAYKKNMPSGFVAPVESEPLEYPRESASVPTYSKQPPDARLFDGHNARYLLSLGVPAAVIPSVREFRSLEDIETAWVEGFYGEDVAQRLYDLARGKHVVPPHVYPVDQRDEASDTRPPVYVIENEILKRHLDAPWERWVTFLSREQRAIVEREFQGPAKVTGTAGTGKTLVALHRAGRLAEAGHKVLLTTYGTTLAQNLSRSLRYPIDDLNARNRITVSTVHARAKSMVRDVKPIGRDDAHAALEAEFRESPVGTLALFSRSEVVSEWDEVIQLQGIVKWEQYRDARRHGRGKGMSAKNRELLWPIFEGARRWLADRGQVTWPDLCLSAAALLQEGQRSSPFGAVIVDEVQDLNVPELQFLWQLAQHCPENFMVVGDAGQRIYPGGYSLQRLGIDIRGRSTRLTTNYRTTREIRLLADAIGHPQADDMDSGIEKRNDAEDDRIGGPEPERRPFRTREEEHRALVDQVGEWVEHGSNHEEPDIGVFVRTRALADQIARKLTETGIEVLRLRKDTNLDRAGVRVGTMHRAKGLEFKAVWVAGVEAGLLPVSKALQVAVDPKSRDDAIKLERSLLYVAMTRARHRLTVSWSGRPSEFLSRVL